MKTRLLFGILCISSVAFAAKYVSINDVKPKVDRGNIHMTVSVHNSLHQDIVCKGTAWGVLKSGDKIFVRMNQVLEPDETAYLEFSADPSNPFKSDGNNIKCKWSE